MWIWDVCECMNPCICTYVYVHIGYALNCVLCQVNIVQYILSYSTLYVLFLDMLEYTCTALKKWRKSCEGGDIEILITFVLKPFIQQLM